MVLCVNWTFNMIETLGGFAEMDIIGLAVIVPRLVVSLVKSG